MKMDSQQDTNQRQIESQTRHSVSAPLSMNPDEQKMDAAQGPDENTVKPVKTHPAWKSYVQRPAFHFALKLVAFILILVVTFFVDCYLAVTGYLLSLETDHDHWVTPLVIIILGLNALIAMLGRKRLYIIYGIGAGVYIFVTVVCLIHLGVISFW